MEELHQRFSIFYSQISCTLQARHTRPLVDWGYMYRTENQCLAIVVIKYGLSYMHRLNSHYIAFIDLQ